MLPIVVFHKTKNYFYDKPVRGYLCGMNVLMVCLGNICRSPLAEGILREKTKNAGFRWKIDSAGTSSYHEGASPHELSQKVARMHGIDISRQICRRFDKEDMLRFDKIYVMDREVYSDAKRLSGELWNPEKTILIMDEVFPGENIEVPDPWFGGEEGYHLAFDMLNEACDAIIKKYMQRNLANQTKPAET